MDKKEIIRFLILRTIGNFLLLFALFGVGATFGPILYYEAQYQIMQLRGIHYTVPVEKIVSGKTSPLGELNNKFSQKVVKQPGFIDVLSSAKENIMIPIDTSFDVLIPKIGANAKIFPNVDPSNPDIFLPILREGVAHAKGSVFPGIKGTTYLFAHSTDNFWNVGRYNAVFYLLKDLKVGDSIVVYYQDQRFNYAVSETKIVAPSDVSYLTQSQQGEEQLVLQTCWPPGTAWERLLVFAKRKI